MLKPSSSGEGGFGTVYKGKLRGETDVAVKTMDLRALRVTGGDAFSVAKLRREVDVLRQLRHPSIVELLGAYGDGDSVRLVMEMVEGRELFDAILERGSYDEAGARPIFVALLEAVASARRPADFRDIRCAAQCLRCSRKCRALSKSLPMVIRSFNRVSEQAWLLKR